MKQTAEITDKPTISPSGLMSLESAALYLGVNLVAVRNLRRFKKLPFCKIAGKVMVKQKDVDAYIEQQTESVV